MREKMLSSLRLSDENICPEVLKPVLCPRCKHVAGHCSSACLVTMIQSPKKNAGRDDGHGEWSNANIQASLVPVRIKLPEDDMRVKTV